MPQLGCTSALMLVVAGALCLPGVAQAATVYKEVVYSGAGCRAENDGILARSDGSIYGVVTTGSRTCRRANTVLQVGMAYRLSNGTWGAYNLKNVDAPPYLAAFHSWRGNITCGAYYASALRFGYRGTIYRGKAIRFCR